VSEKLQQAVQLLNSNKNRRALAILKKLNSKVKNQTFQSLQMEGVALARDKKYIQAELSFYKALERAVTFDENCETLLNLKGTSYSLGNKKQAMEHLKKILTLKPGHNTAKIRLEYCKLCYAENEFEKIISETPHLFGLNEYAPVALLLSIEANAKLGKKENIPFLFNKLLADLNKLNGPQVEQLLTTLDKLTDTKRLALVINSLGEKFSHEKWFQKFINSSTGTDSVNMKSRTQSQLPNKRIVGSNKETTKTIKSLIDQLEGMGAKFHEKLHFVEKENNLSIHLSPIGMEEIVLSVPIKCMPLINDYDLSIVNKQLHANPIKDARNPDAFPIMKTMVDLYNQTNKIADWSDSYPLLALKNHPDFVQLLLINSTFSKKIQKYKRLYDTKQWTELCLLSYIGSRNFSYPKALLASARIKTKNEQEDGLLAIIDFLNHKFEASGYFANNKSAQIEIKSNNTTSTEEVFVRYNLFDPLLTYLLYGFVDLNSPILYSGIVTLTTLTGNKISIFGGSGKASKETMKGAQHLEMYMPNKTKREGNTINVSHLTIPNAESKDTLPQVISKVLQDHDFEGYYTDINQLNKEVNQLELQLISKNLAYWESLNVELKKVTKSKESIAEITTTNITNLCGFAIKHLNNYQKARKLTTFI